MDRRLFFSTSTELVFLPIDSLVYVKADGNYSVVTMIDGSNYVLTLKLGQVEYRIAEVAGDDDDRFMRIGKSLIVNLEFITYVNPFRQKIVLSDGCTFRYEVSASRDALKGLKELIETKQRP